MSFIEIDRRLFQLFVCTFPFLSAFGLAVWLPLPTAIAIGTALWFIVTGRFWQALYLEVDDLLLAAVVILGMLGVALHLSYAGSKNINYTLWFISTFAIFIVWCRAWMRAAQITPSQIGAAATAALVIASIAVCAEFALANITGIYLSDIIPYSTASEDLTRASVLLVLWRPRGLAAEPTCTAIVFEALAPLAWIYLRDKRVLFALSLAIVLPGFILCFSAGGWVCLFLSALIVVVLRRGLGRSTIVALAFVVIVALIVVTNNDAQWIFDQVIGRKITDLAGTGNSAVDTVAGRAMIYQSAVAIFSNYPFGIGWGMISQIYDTGAHIPNIPQPVSRGMVSLYLEILVSAGVLGLLLFLTYLVRKILKLAKRINSDATAVLFALITVSIHHAVVLEFWYPMVWFLICLADYLAESTAVEAADEPGVSLLPEWPPMLC